MSDPRFIPPSDREEDARRAYSRLHAINKLLAHAAFMDERDARQRDLIRRLADNLEMCICDVEMNGGAHYADMLRNLIAEARGIEAPNE